MGSRYQDRGIWKFSSILIFVGIPGVSAAAFGMDLPAPAWLLGFVVACGTMQLVAAGVGRGFVAGAGYAALTWLLVDGDAWPAAVVGVVAGAWTGHRRWRRVERRDVSSVFG